MKFKVGDKVRLIASPVIPENRMCFYAKFGQGNASNLDVTSSYEIVRIDETDKSCYVNTGPYTHDMLWLLEEQLMLVNVSSTIKEIEEKIAALEVEKAKLLEDQQIKVCDIFNGATFDVEGTRYSVQDYNRKFYLISDNKIITDCIYISTIVDDLNTRHAKRVQECLT